MSKLSHFSIPWKALKRSKLPLTLTISAVVVGWLFLSLLDSQKQNTDPNLVRAVLKSEKKILEILKWQAKFIHCNDTCSDVGEKSYELQFPDFSGVGAIVKSITPKPTHAVLSYELTENDRQWIATHPVIVLVLPRMVHQITINQTTFERPKSYGLGANVNFPMLSKRLASKTKIKLEVKFDPYDFFGPADLPIILGTPESASIYGNLGALSVASSFLGKQLDIGIPLLLTCIALILDHSLVFSILSVLAAFRALRYFISFDYSLANRTFPQAVADPLLVFINAMTLIILVLFVCEFSHVKLKKKWWWTLSIVSISGFFIAFKSSPNFIVTSDLWSDFIGCIIAIPIAIYGLKSHFWHNRNFDKKTNNGIGSLEKEVEKSTAISSTLFILRFFLILFALGATAWVNVSDYFQIESLALKESLNWAHSALLPVLIVAALLEIGSTSKKMKLFSQVMVSKALIDRDMQVGKEIQEQLLPVRRGNNKHWAWRAFYYPAVSLAGDWFDIRTIKFKDDKELIFCCLADVTGHGIGAALITTTISSHWGIWCDSIAQRECPSTDAEREALLVEAPRAVHAGLTALKRNSGCTAGFMFMDNDTGKMTYSIAGHPGILTQYQNKMGFYYTSGTRPGFEGASLDWQAKTTQIEIGESIHLFSDGIVPPGQAVGVWLKRVQRSQKKSDRSLSVHLLSCIRENRGIFRKDRSKEDDMSLVIFSRLS